MKKWSSLCLSALLAGALLAGCGGAAPAAASSEAGSVSAGASSASAPQSESAGGYTTTLADIQQKGTLFAQKQIEVYVELVDAIGGLVQLADGGSDGSHISTSLL